MVKSMIKRPDCEFLDGSYPCGYKDEGKLPDCELCEKIREASIKEVADYIESLLTDGWDKWHYYNKDLAEQIRKEI